MQLAEKHDVDPNGNKMPEGMFWRNGVYYVQRRLRGRRLKQSTRKRDYKSALRRYHEIMHAWNDGASGWDAPQQLSFAEYWEKHYRPAYTVRKTPLPRGDGKTFRDDQLVKAALAEFGRQNISNISKTMAQKFANRRRASRYYIRNKEGVIIQTKQLSEGTVTRELSFLQALFEQAKEDGLIEKNPFKGIEREAYATRERVLSVEEQGKLLAALSPRYARWALFMLGTGLRLEEARGIDEAHHLDFVKRQVFVTRKSRGVKKTTMWVPMIDPSTLDVLQEQLTVDGELWHANQQEFRKVLAAASRKAGIEHVSPHVLRHTYATRYLQAGGNIYTLSQILGHSSVAVTEKVYAHLLSQDLLALSKGIDLGLKPAEPSRVLPFFKVGA